MRPQSQLCEQDKDNSDSMRMTCGQRASALTNDRCPTAAIVVVRRVGLSALGLVCLVFASAQTAYAIPADDLLKSLHPMGDVNDFAGVLSQSDRTAIETRCRQLRERTGAQLAVVVLPSMQGGQLEDFTNKLFAQWGVGQKGKNNGVMLLVAMKERQSRIEVGYGLEPIIPDVLAGRILDHQLRPAFREAHYGQGLKSAVNKLCELIERGEPANRAALNDPQGMTLGGKIGATLFLCLFVVIGTGIAVAGWTNRVVVLLLFGLAFGGFAFIFGCAAAWPIGPIVHVPVAGLTGYGVWRLVQSQAKRPKKSGKRRSTSDSGWTWGGAYDNVGGGWSSGGGGGFPSDSGGFSGGSSGGGGASSSW